VTWYGGVIWYGECSLVRAPPPCCFSCPHPLALLLILVLCQAGRVALHAWPGKRAHGMHPLPTDPKHASRWHTGFAMCLPALLHVCQILVLVICLPHGCMT